MDILVGMNVSSHWLELGHKFSLKYLSSPEPPGAKKELIVYPCAAVRYKPFSKIFFWKTAWPIKAKFYAEPPLMRKGN